VVVVCICILLLMLQHLIRSESSQNLSICCTCSLPNVIYGVKTYLYVTLIGLLACMLVGEYFPEMVDSALKFSSFYASRVYILLSYICMYSRGIYFSPASLVVGNNTLLTSKSVTSKYGNLFFPNFFVCLWQYFVGIGIYCSLPICVAGTPVCCAKGCWNILMFMGIQFSLSVA